MAKTRLTNSLRWSIIRTLLKFAYDEQNEALDKTKLALAERALDHILTPAARKKMAALPKGWMGTSNSLCLNAGGWQINLHDVTEFIVPYVVIYDHRGRQDITDPALISELQAYATAETTYNEGRVMLERQLYSLLQSCTTLEAFIEAMPEAEEPLKDLVVPAKPKNQLVTTGKQVMCLISKARGEEREGCCDGTLAEETLAA